MSRRQSRAADYKQWFALSVSAHRTDAVGQLDGYSILLLPETESEPEPVLGKEDDAGAMDVDAGAESKDNEGLQIPRSQLNETTNEIYKHYSGPRNYACFEFLDSIQSY